MSDTHDLYSRVDGAWVSVASTYERHIQIPAILTGTPAAQPDDIDFFTAGGLQYVASGAKYAYCQWELPSDWDGNDIFFEVDWMPDSAAMSGVDAVRWTVEYRAIAEGELINAGTSVTLSNGVGGDTGDHARYKTIHSRMTMAHDDAAQPLTVQDHLYLRLVETRPYLVTLAAPSPLRRMRLSTRAFLFRGINICFIFVAKAYYSTD